MNSESLVAADNASEYVARAEGDRQHTGYRLTDVGMIPSEWRCTRLTSVAQLESGHTPSRRQPKYWDGEIPWVSLHDTGSLDGREICNTAQTVSQEGIAHSSARVLPAGTVVLSRTATVGKSTILGREMATSQDFANYICGPLIHNVFLVYLFRHMAPVWKKLMAGSIHNTVYMPVFQSLQIPLPPLREQSAIAEALSDVDGLIGGLDRLIAKKRAIKQATMQQLLTGRTRLPGFTGKWETKRLGEIAAIARGASPRPIDSPEWFDEESEVGWVRISDVSRSGKYLYSTSQYLSRQGIRHSRPVAIGSLIMSICATVGRPTITKLRTCIHDGFVVFDNLKADRDYLYFVLRNMEGDWSESGQSGSQMNLNTGLISNTEISIPTAEEQSAIASILSDMDAEIEALERRREKIQSIKQGMMQQLLTGRIRLV